MKPKVLFSAVICALTFLLISSHFASRNIYTSSGKLPQTITIDLKSKAVNNMNNTTYGYTTTHSRLKRGHLANTLSKYADFDNLLDRLLTFTIPGLENTFVGKDIQSMIPQGICIADGYFLTTAYDSQKNSGSCIYAISTDCPRSLRCVIELPFKAHAGGIAFDGENIWICGSDEVKDNSKFGVMHRITFKDLKEKIENGKSYASIGADIISKYYISNSASFCTYFNERLWVGTFTDYSSEETTYGSLMSYNPDNITLIDETNHLSFESFLLLPNRAQGVCFFQNGIDTYMLLSRSYSRNSLLDKSSYISEIRAYKPVFDSDNPFKIAKKGNAFFTIPTPPMIEEICFDTESNRLYAMFESGASKYSIEGKTPLLRCNYIFDKIAALDISGLIQ